MSLTKVSSNRFIYDLSLFDTIDKNYWEEAYNKTIDKKYKKNTRNFNKKIKGKPQKNEANIYIVPRIRGGPSFKSFDLEGVNNEDVQYCPTSKGFPMQNVSSFTIGPIINEGLCLVNAAFSKQICTGHIEGRGKINLNRKNFWQRSKNPKYNIQIIDNKNICVNGEIFDKINWLKENENEWFPEWDRWRKSVALCSYGGFNWSSNMGDVLSYRKGNEYLNFVEWKKYCYIMPSYELLNSKNDAYNFLEDLKSKNINIALVHPMGHKHDKIKPITTEIIRNFYDSDDIMCCQPYVIAGKLLDVPIFEY